jgi:hypothetical protein
VAFTMSSLCSPSTDYWHALRSCTDQRSWCVSTTCVMTGATNSFLAKSRVVRNVDERHDAPELLAALASSTPENYVFMKSASLSGIMGSLRRKARLISRDRSVTLLCIGSRSS